ncbi:hypothetical protein BKA62DRAFT_676312 [Auriculariales sp. MPI-PUGE-AT-0066]|nr:hypothetical protein BKA62DRAFT_676312 [Auriculariales sp. MPI-PUGE-AT-0066]
MKFKKIKSVFALAKGKRASAVTRSSTYGPQGTAASDVGTPDTIPALTSLSEASISSLDIAAIEIDQLADEAVVKAASHSVDPTVEAEEPKLAATAISTSTPTSETVVETSNATIVEEKLSEERNLPDPLAADNVAAIPTPIERDVAPEVIYDRDAANMVPPTFSPAPSEEVTVPAESTSNSTDVRIMLAKDVACLASASSGLASASSADVSISSAEVNTAASTTTAEEDEWSVMNILAAIWALLRGVWWFVKNHEHLTGGKVSIRSATVAPVQIFFCILVLLFQWVLIAPFVFLWHWICGRRQSNVRNAWEIRC